MPSRRDFESGIHTELSHTLDYSSYLHLDQILNAQHPLSKPAYHDEMAFIIQHQTSELWMLLIIHEVTAAIEELRKDELSLCFKVLARVKQIQRMLFEQWAVLETLTPTEFARFRGFLGPASGLQSYQFRLIEFLFGNKEPKMLKVYAHRPHVQAQMEKVLKAPSLYDEFLAFLSRKGFAIPEECLHRDWSQPYQSHPKLPEIFLQIYQAPEDHWEAYELAEKLMDVDLHMSLWRYRHLRLVERIIGFKPGTGGSSGASFLRQGADIKLFPELWEVRTLIGCNA